MAAIQNLLARFGFVKLNRYGLVLTPEGRILSMRPAVMDDGLGGRIVGWQDSDLVATELARWEPAKPAAVTGVASAPPITRLQPAAVIPRPVAPPPIPAPRITAAMPVVPAISAMPVAPKAEEPEDDWEWTIALARARAAAEEVELAAAPLARPAPRRTRQDTVPPPPVMRTQPMAVVAAPAMPKPAEVVALPRASSPRTIIPVPKLPVMKSPPRFEPVVRSSSMGVPHALPALPRRMAKGTGPVAPKGADTRPMISVPEVGDRTQTSIELADQTQQTVLPRVARAR